MCILRRLKIGRYRNRMEFKAQSGGFIIPESHCRYRNRMEFKGKNVYGAAGFGYCRYRNRMEFKV